MAKTIDEFIESNPVDPPICPKSLVDLVMISIRIPRDVLIKMDIAAKAAGKSRLKYSSDLTEAAMRQVWDSVYAGGEQYEGEFKKRCLEAGVFLDEFLTHEKQLKLWDDDHKNLKEGEDDVQA